jgi:hypothetical protein
MMLTKAPATARLGAVQIIQAVLGMVAPARVVVVVPVRGMRLHVLHILILLAVLVLTLSQRIGISLEVRNNHYII